ncbi:Virion host shutoff protein [Dirofilaria immitis]
MDVIALLNILSLYVLFVLLRFPEINFLGLSDFIDIEGNNSEDDSPVEASSKMKCDMSVAGNISNLKSKKMKTKSRRKYKVVKLNESVYKSETKTSTFKVVPLSVMPQPSLNFRAQLLQKRTGNQRLTKMEQAGLRHKNKWFAATRPGCR